ncbi:MAG: hypothetical protein H6713_32815 [Myxococcales bacterium]|nr:hypothetical protein [Myxococcales bacterium]MCB9754743.1 hypothetical protein [Myxococcales bacterium]
MSDPSPIVRRRDLLTLLAGLATIAALGACKGKSEVVYPRKVGAGRPPGCPETNAVPLGADNDSLISADAARCTYADALGGSVTRVSGKVLAESGEPGVPDSGMSGVEVTLHKLEGAINPNHPGEQVGRSSTTAQGNYSVSAPLSRGRYLLIVHDVASSRVLTYRAIDIGDDDMGPMTDVHVVVPLDPSLKPAPALHLDAGVKPKASSDGSAPPSE